MKQISAMLLCALLLSACGGGQAPTRNPGRGGVVSAGAKYPYARPVPGREGLVYSPYSEREVHIDVRGFERGTEVRDPWTDQIFLVP